MLKKRQDNHQRQIFQILHLSVPKCFCQNVPSRSEVCVQGEWQKWTPPSPPSSKDDRLKDIGYSTSIRNLILGVSSVTVSYLIRYDSLLKNGIDIITKCDTYFITKCDRSLLQNASGFFLLQNATVITNATFITNCDSTYWKIYPIILLKAWREFVNFQAL